MGQVAPRPCILPAPTLARLQGGPGQQGLVRDEGPLCFHGGDPQSCCLPCCAGDSVTPGTQTSIQRPLQRAWRGCPLRGKVAEDRSRGSGEQHGNAAGKGGCRGTAPYRVRGGGWGLGFASTSFIPNITVPCLCPGKQQWGWHRARREGWGRKEARHPMGISPAAHSEIAWVNQHESCWEMGVRTGTAQLVPAVRKLWRKKEREALGLLIPRRTWLHGAVSGLGLLSPRATTQPLPWEGVGGGAGLGQHGCGRDWQCCLRSCGLWQATVLPFCPELIWAEVLPQVVLALAGPWAYHELLLVPRTARIALASAAWQRSAVCVGLPAWPNPPCSWHSVHCPALT